MAEEEEIDHHMFDYVALGGQYGWFIRADHEPQERRVPFNRPKPAQVLQLMPFVLRYFAFWLRHSFSRERLFIDIFRMLRHDPYCALSCGGIGAGSIGRDYRGAFNKFNLRPGLVQTRSRPVKASQFILTLSTSDGALVRQVVLSALHKFPSKALSSWQFSLSPSDVTYRALYPRAWTKFELPKEKVTVIMRQISPVLPRDYKNSSLPCTVFAFQVINNSNRSLNVSITFTFCNENGQMKCMSNEVNNKCSSELFECGEVKGVLLHQHFHGIPCTFALSAHSTVHSFSATRSFKPTGNGSALWNQLASDGKLSEIVEERVEKDALGVAVSLQTMVSANGRTEREMTFTLIWHMPIVHFGGQSRNFRRWYSQFFDEDQQKGAAELCEYSLQNYKKWENAIEKWQRPTLDNAALPDWLKSALFNELYFLTDGGTVWFCCDPEWPIQEPQMSEYSSQHFTKFGRFAYLESWEYRMMNTYDVHFYASFALGDLFPQLEHSIQSDFNDQIGHCNPKSVKYHMNGKCAPLKALHRVPHDLGNPADEPWVRNNVYQFHHTGDWKDLNLKFVLCAYRTYHCVLGRDRHFLAQVWPQIRNIVDEALEHWDINNDGMIENFGTADQTYDAWSMHGASAYCGSLWLATLRIFVAIAQEMNEPKLATDYQAVLERAKEVFQAKLWNGLYFNFDERSKTIMADQLCGYWFLHSIDPQMANDILPIDQVKSALDTIFDFNVCKFADGKLGAVNGIGENGKVDPSLQANEVWIGTTYALASFFIQMGDSQRAFLVAHGPYSACYHRMGLQFQTPEALYERRFYRAIGYMRALSIWAIHCALRRETTETIERNSKEENGNIEELST